MPLNFKEQPKFLINRELSKSPDTLANLVDRQALLDFYGQQRYQDVTAQLSRSTVLRNPDESRQATPFLDFLKDNGRTITTTENRIRFSKTGKANVNYRILRTTNLTQPGIGRSPFKAILTTDVFKPGSKVRPEEDLLEQLTVVAGPVGVGDGYEYTFRYNNDDKNLYFPPEYLVEGTRFVSAGSANFAEGSDGWGPTHFDTGHSVLTWEVGLFRTGKELTITDDVIAHAWGIDEVDVVNGNKVKIKKDMPKLFTTEAEMKMVAEAEWEKEQDLLFSSFTQTIADTNRKPRDIGGSVFDHLRDGNVYDYNPANGSIREFADRQDSVWANSTGMIKYGTGREGLKLVDQWIHREFDNVTVIRNPEDYIERTGQIPGVPGGRDGWKLKNPMFVAYETAVTGLITFEVWPSLDDPYSRGPKHPVTGKNLLSYHFIGQNYNGEYGVDSNIHYVTKANSKIFYYENGATGPYGPINDREGGKYVGTHNGRFTTLRMGEQYGIFLEDVNDFIWIRPNIKGISG